MIFKTKIVTKLSVLLRMIILFEILIYKNKFIFLVASIAFLDYFNQFGVRSVSLPSLITRTSSNHEQSLFLPSWSFSCFFFFSTSFLFKGITSVAFRRREGETDRRD